MQADHSEVIGHSEWAGGHEEDRPRLLIYSHDTFGLGHLRRCLKIAKSLQRAYPDLSILLVTGSPVVHRYELPIGMDYVKLPAVRKTGPEKYEARSLKIGYNRIESLRRNIILSTVKAFDPHFLLVDHAPVGMKGELEPAMQWIKQNAPNAVCILGLRDIIDDPKEIVNKWTQSGTYEVLRHFYDHIMVYGPSEIFDTVFEYRFPDDIKQKVTHCSYIGEDVVERVRHAAYHREHGRPARVVVTIGGGDGAFDTLIRPYIAMLARYSTELNIQTTIVTGPFVGEDQWQWLNAQHVNAKLTIKRFVPSLRRYLTHSELVISTAGYNSTTEALSWARRCLLVPRKLHRSEQQIRAQRLSALGYVEYLEPERASPETLFRKITDMLSDPKEPLTELRQRTSLITDGCAEMVTLFGSLIHNLAQRNILP